MLKMLRFASFADFSSQILPTATVRFSRHYALAPKPRIPNVKLNDNREMPIIGLGTWKANPGEVGNSVKMAIDAGYRHLDCAYMYGNESEVGEAIKAKIDEGVVKRNDLFVTSKLWNTFHRKQAVIPSLKESLSYLSLDYLDLYLIHTPMGLKEGKDPFPANPDGTFIYSDVDYLETWLGMEEAAKLGLAKSIGVANFNHLQIERMLKNAKIPPAVNQVEISPYCSNEKLVNYCQSKGIAVTAFSSFGSTPDPSELQANPSANMPKLLEDRVLKELARKLDRSVPQVILRWAIQHNIIVIPKSVTKSRIEENINVFDFTLTSEEMKRVDALNRNLRTLTAESYKTHKYFPYADY